MNGAPNISKIILMDSNAHAFSSNLGILNFKSFLSGETLGTPHWERQVRRLPYQIFASKIVIGK